MSERPNFRPPRREFLSAAFLAAIQGSLSPRISLGAFLGAFKEDSNVFKGESLEGWMTLDGQNVRSGWEAKGGAMSIIETSNSPRSNQNAEWNLGCNLLA